MASRHRSRLWRFAVGAVLALAAGVGGPVHAGSHTTTGRIQVDAWSKRDGLPQGTVTSLVRDDAGYLWLGTFAGLYRFSGTHFEEQVAPPDLYARVARITALAKDGDRLWVGVEEGGVWRFHDGTYLSVDQPDVLREATVWAVVVEEGTPEATIVVASSAGLWRRSASSGWERLSDQAALTVARVAPDTYWVGNHVSLWRLSEGVSEPPVRTGAFFGLWVDPDGDLWASSRVGPVLVPNGGLPVAAVDWTHHLELGVVPTVDPRGILWLGGSSGVARLGPWQEAKAAMLAGEPLHPEWVTLGNAPRSLLIDDDNTTWVGTKSDGLRRVTERPFKRVALPPDVRGYATGPLAHASGRTWLSLDCDQLYGFEAGVPVAHIAVNEAPGPKEGSRCVHAMAAAADGAVFVGYQGKLWRVADGAWSTPRLPGEGLRPTEIPSLLEVDRSGTLWVGTSEGRLFSGPANGQAPLSSMAMPEGTHRVLSRLSLADGRLAVGTTEGLWVQDADGWTHHTCASGFACGPVRDLAVGADHTIWAATYGGGLGWVHTGQAGRITPADHRLPDGFLSSVEVGPDGQVWLHGNRGLNAVGASELIAARRGELEALRMQHFDVGEANGWARPSSWMDSENTLWLVTVDGMVSVAADTDRESWTPGRVDIESVKAGTYTFPEKQREVVLEPHMGRAVEVRFSAPVLRPDQLARFEYRLYPQNSSGNGEPFSEPMARTAVTLAGLDAGHYTFEVRAVGAGGQRGASESLSIVVERAWLEHPYLPVGVVLVALLLAAGVALTRLRVAESRSRQLSEEVSERREVERRLEAQRRFYRQVFDSAGVALLLFDATSRCIEVNREACTLFGVDRAELLSWTPAHLGLETSRGAGTPGRCRRPDGTSFPARVVSASFVSDVQRFFLVSVTDLSGLLAERGVLQDRRLALLLSHRASALSHYVRHRAVDLGRTLGAILAQANLGALALSEDAPESEAAASLKAVEESARDGGRTSAELSRLLAPPEDEPGSIDIEPVCRTVEDALRSVLPDDVECVMSVESGGRVRMRRTDLELVLFELAVNAGAAMPDGGRVRLTVSREGGSMVFTVRDQGNGLSPDVLQAATEPFFTTRSAEGALGLGLTMVHDIVQAAGGTLALTNRARRGADVVVRIPVASARPGVVPIGPARSRRHARQGHVCVVDDNVHVMRAIQVPLEMAGYRVTAFDDPVRAVEWCRSTDSVPQVLVTDVVMPNLTGRQLADAVRRTFPQVEVLFVSGYTDDVVLRRGVDGSVENLLVKPFSKHELLSRVESLLSGRSR